MHAVVNPPYIEYRAAGQMITTYMDQAKRQSEMWYTKVADLASKSGVKFSSETILDVVSAADSIIDYARNNNAI